MQSINPTNGKLIKEYKEYSNKEVINIIDAVEADWQIWKKTSFSHRKNLMQNAAQVLLDKKQEFAETMSLEMGKPLTESLAEVEKSAWVCNYYADEAENILADEYIESDASKSFVSFEPIGIVLAVMPWNFPFWQVFRFAAPALMAGNAAVLKHASNVQGSANDIERVFKLAGFPKNLFRNLIIKSNQVEAVIENPKIKASTLTGSEFAGSRVAMASGRKIKKTVLELGGADAFIILKDADIEKAAKVAVQARMLNNGQSCIAAKRFIIDKSVLSSFISLINSELDLLKIGNPLENGIQIGPLARADLREEIHSQVEQTIEQGATLLRGGKFIEEDGYFYEPTIISNLKPGMKLYYEESFGPVFSIFSFDTEEEAIQIANDSDFGLGGSLWTKDLAKGESLARKIESGGIFINGMTKSDPRLPFGGIKKSGYGRELSHYGIKEFVNMKTIWIG
ncbi:MAG: NAD-dependent succinate-semialdehyde dehydrogenase [Bacteroidetes bacterium]|nr:MAG: NAD-dependent succinate-semialdehyde dehydrogenase [Bacteroidota bacterium]